MKGFSPAERLARLRLARSEGIGAVGFGQLIALHGSGVGALQALEEARRPVFAMVAATAEFEAANSAGARHIFLGEAEYPPLLAEIASPPPMLVVLGDIALAHRPAVGIVGARNASAAGRTIARQLAEALGEAGWTVVSGLARGIDREAHIGSLPTGTIGCVAGGVDIAYPPENRGLQDEVAGNGLLLSEMPPGTEPQARHFPRRNRLIAGLAQGLVVIEAAPGSGSLITARLAGEAGREVMAVPGHPADPRSAGGNGLIRDGAHLVGNAEDVLAALGPFVVKAEFKPKPKPVRQRQMAFEAPVAVNEGGLLPLLSVAGVALDELVRASGFSASHVQAMLADLELEGRVVRLAGGRVALASG